MRSLCNKFDLIVSEHENSVIAASILAFTESWLSDNVDDARLQINDFDLYRSDRNSHGGVIAFYVSNMVFPRVLYL